MITGKLLTNALESLDLVTPNNYLVHHKKKPFDVFIARPSKWGNPFSHKAWATSEFKTQTKAESLYKHRQWVLNNPQFIKEIKKELTDKILGCWCENPLACHGLVLWEVANGIQPKEPPNIQRGLFDNT